MSVVIGTKLHMKLNFKFKMAAGYHVDSDGYPASY